MIRIVVLSLLATACSPSPLFVGQRAVGTGGDVPRDGNGVPIWAAIRPVPESAVPVPTRVPVPMQGTER
jgi:hypothetical protein